MGLIFALDAIILRILLKNTDANLKYGLYGHSRVYQNMMINGTFIDSLRFPVAEFS